MDAACCTFFLCKSDKPEVDIGGRKSSRPVYILNYDIALVCRVDGASKDSVGGCHRRR